MKNLNKIWIITLVLFSLSSTVLLAQEKEKTIKIKIQKEVNGEMKTIEKTYKSIEEMKNDPELKEMNAEFMGNGSFFFSNDEGNFNINIDKGEDGDLHKNHFFFKMNGDKITEFKGETNIEVIKGDDGKVTILRNGEPVEKGDNVIIHELKEGDLDAIEHIKVKKTDDGNKMIIINGEEGFEWTEGQDVDIHEDVEVIVNSLKNAKDGDSQNQSVIKISIRKVKIHIEDIAKKDESLKSLNLDNKRELKLQQLNYYPNPTEGKFNLSFQGKSVPTEVRITDLTGKTIFSDVISDFEGQYNNDIDLNDQSKGVYIMQIIQGNKAVNKKIIID